MVTLATSEFPSSSKEAENVVKGGEGKRRRTALTSDLRRQRRRRRRSRPSFNESSVTREAAKAESRKKKGENTNTMSPTHRQYNL
ncbi:hypothetical protein KFK09_010107 [Dendrobium nobile]|uniref:Uncharacterized protein n=1 Tax=Dendrobium nobile TaxID=94219 RepID=A0A8T3BNG0_DENNO|nr:hypothetical protein KFK09_010107 [Dendrobium nobile]